MFASFVFGAVLSFTALDHDREIQLPVGHTLEIAEARLRADTTDMEIRRRAAAVADDMEFRTRMNQFAAAFNSFAQDYAKGLLNVKKARTLSKAMHQLQSVLPRE